MGETKCSTAHDHCSNLYLGCQAATAMVSNRDRRGRNSWTLFQVSSVQPLKGCPGSCLAHSGSDFKFPRKKRGPAGIRQLVSLSRSFSFTASSLSKPREHKNEPSTSCLNTRFAQQSSDFIWLSGLLEAAAPTWQSLSPAGRDRQFCYPRLAWPRGHLLLGRHKLNLTYAALNLHLLPQMQMLASCYTWVIFALRNI